MIVEEGLLDKIKHHEKLAITLNENCKISLPDYILEKLLQPHKLDYYYFVFIDEGAETYTIDLEDIHVYNSQLVFGLPNQIFKNPLKQQHNKNYKIGFDQSTLALLPHSYPFLVNPFNTNLITFSPDAKLRVKNAFAILFQLLHSAGKQKKVDIILAYIHTLLTEFNNAYFAGTNYESNASPKLSKYIAFKLAVEDNLTEQHDVHTIAEKLDMTTSSLYAIVKDFSGISPKEWITSRLILEAQRKLQYSSPSVKELAYDLGFNDPNYFSRLFKKNTGKSVSEFLAGLHDLSSQ